MRSGWRNRPRVALVLALALAVSLLVVGDRPGDPTVSTQSAETAVDLVAQDAPAAAPEGVAEPRSAAAPVAAVEPGAATAPAQDLDRLVVPNPGPQPTASSARESPRAATADSATTNAAASAAASASEQTFAREYPEHAAARQRDDVPSSFHWAVIIGINDYMGRTTSTIGSVGDAMALREALVREGWRGDQVLTLTEHAATHDGIVRAIEWLIRSTDERSTVVFSFSGHMRHESGVTALWPADNQFMWAGDLGRMLGAVRADRMWVSLQGCHAAGLAAPGVEGANRVVTYASRVEEKAYEDPTVGRSVMGHYLFAEGLRDGRGDRQAGNGDGRVSAQEAFAWAAPAATSRTTGQQPYGAQRPVIVDSLGGREFPIAVTGPPPSAAPSPPSGGDQGRATPPRESVVPGVPPLQPRVRVAPPESGILGSGRRP